MRTARPFDKELAIRRLRAGTPFTRVARELGVRYELLREFAAGHGFAPAKRGRKTGHGFAPAKHGRKTVPERAPDVKWLVYTCAKCGGTFQLDVSRDEHGVQTKSAYPVRKRARIGGHWWCGECARRRYRIDRTAEREVPPAFWGAQ